MPLRLLKFWLLVAVLSSLVTAAPGGPLMAQGRPFSATLTGAAEAPGPGDPDGAGTAELTLSPGRGEICWVITVANISLPATAAHIHVALAGVAGPIVVTLSPPGAREWQMGAPMMWIAGWSNQSSRARSYST